jgi:hypothetical protein
MLRQKLWRINPKTAWRAILFRRAQGAGNGAASYSGDFFILDSGKNRVRELAFAGSPALALANASLATGGSYQVIATSPYRRRDGRAAVNPTNHGNNRCIVTVGGLAANERPRRRNRPRHGGDFPRTGRGDGDWFRGRDTSCSPAAGY